MCSAPSAISVCSCVSAAGGKGSANDHVIMRARLRGPMHDLRVKFHPPFLTADKLRSLQRLACSRVVLVHCLARSGIARDAHKARPEPHAVRTYVANGRCDRTVPRQKALTAKASRDRCKLSCTACSSGAARQHDSGNWRGAICSAYPEAWHARKCAGIQATPPRTWREVSSSGMHCMI